VRGCNENHGPTVPFTFVLLDGSAACYTVADVWWLDCVRMGRICLSVLCHKDTIYNISIHTLCRNYPNGSIIARNVVKNDQISSQFDIPGICDNPVKIIPAVCILPGKFKF
jgi:hypothetical protein